VEAYLQRFEGAEVKEKKRMLADMKRRAKLREQADGAVFAKNERRALKKAYKKEIVKRSAVLRIVAAWIVTVPATAVLAAILFHIIAAVLS
jgi:inorganic phosphate transporter, PiT family